MSSTPEQLRAVADAFRHTNLTTSEYNALRETMLPDYQYVMRQMQRIDSRYIMDATALALELDALRIEQEACLPPPEQESAWMNMQDDVALAAIVRKHWEAQP